ncbi:MAG: DUF4153 domain-containing protein [Bacteroidota bacterium]
MKQQIIESINDPDQLENLYREDPKNFEKCFSEISGEYDTSLVRFWTIRLAPERTTARTGSQLRGLVEMLAIAAFTAILVLIPALFKGVDREFFYLRDIALIAFNGLIIYSFRLNPVSGLKNVMLYGAVLIATGLYINLLPTGPGDSILIAGLHVPLMLWCFFGLAYVQFNYRSLSGRMDFIRFTGELVIMSGLILLAGGVLTVVTLGLFDVIGMDIEQFYTGFIAVPGAVAAPIIAYYLIKTYPGITSKIAPVIARIFTPVVLVTLTVYLISLLFSTGSILENRELLIIFNVMLLGVLALILFSISGINKGTAGKNTLLALFLLSVMAIVINSIALIAIISRISEGLTPNRTVVLLTNILVFLNLILIAIRLYLSRFKGAPVELIEKSVARYLAVYAGWTVIAIFILPVAFGFR